MGGFPGGSDSKESTCNAGDMALIPRLGRSPGEGNGNSLWYSSLGNPMDRGAWWASVHGITNSWTCPVTNTSVLIFLEVFATTIRQEKEIKVSKLEGEK